MTKKASASAKIFLSELEGLARKTKKTSRL